MKAKLRGHHLICLNFFRGEGYSENFIKNIYAILKNEKLEVVNGPDEICARCPYLEDNKCSSNEYTDEKILLQDKEALRLLGFKPGQTVDWKIIGAKLPGIMEEWKVRFWLDCSPDQVHRYLSIVHSSRHKSSSYAYLFQCFDIIHILDPSSDKDIML